MVKVKKNTKVVKKKDSIELAALVSSRVEINDVRIVNCRYFQTPLASQGKQNIDFNFSVKVSLQKEHNLVLVFPKFKMTALPEGKGVQEPSIEVEAEFLLFYHINDFKGITLDCVKAFGEFNGVYNAWPYWREFVQDSISRMGLPKLTIPVYRFGQTFTTSGQKQVTGRAIKTKKKSKKKTVKKKK